MEIDLRVGGHWRYVMMEDGLQEAMDALEQVAISLR